MKITAYLVLGLIILALLAPAAWSVTATFQVGVTIVAPPVTAEMANYSESFQANTPAANQIQSFCWDVHKSITSDGVLVTYLMK